MSVDGAAVTSAEAARYRAAGWWSDATLSDCVRHNAASSPDKPAYIDFSLDAKDHQLTWSEFDRAATNLANELCNLGVGARRSRCVVAQRQCGDPRRADGDRTLRRRHRWTRGPRGRA